ncbi:MAG: phosphate/phosphite/phosphonate ABC transporter substrate-binding protein [Nitrospirae bacterium]|nr:MAG: phosphate/phosphite/phosphonate ABC transporter substrate-binding protein [Nitrospirota bacterium]
MTIQNGRSRNMLLLTLLLIGLYFAGAFSDDHALAAEGYNFGVVPQFEQRKLYSIWKPVIEELERRTGLSIKLITTLNIEGFEKEYIKGNFDFVYMNPYFILLGDESNRYIPLVRDKAPLRGILVVHKDSPIKKISELNGKTVAFPSPNAIGASVLMRADLERLYKTKVKPLYVKTHSSVYIHVAQGLASAGGGVEKSLQEQDAAVRDSLKVLYTTRDIPSHPVAAHPRVSKEDREKIRRAFIDMAKTEHGRKLLSAIPIKNITSTTVEDYNPMQDWGLDAYWDPFWKED